MYLFSALMTQRIDIIDTSSAAPYIAIADYL